MTISQVDANNVLTAARGFFKGGLKSENKVYMNPSTPEEIARNNNIGAAANNIGVLRANPGQHASAAAAGTQQVRQSSNFGNCGEMSEVVAHYARLIIGMRAREIRICTIGPPGDHDFVMIRGSHARLSIGAFLQAHPSVDRLARWPATGYWVIDCWTNVACPSYDYRNRVERKFTKWDSKQKYIKTGVTQPGQTHPLTHDAVSPLGAYYDGFIHGALSSIDAL